MATTTVNMGLTKPTKATDLADVDVLNANSDKIDVHDHSAGKGVQVAIADGAVTTGKIADGAITAAKILAGAITSTKMATGAIIADHIGNGEVTPAKLSAAPYVEVTHSAHQAIPSAFAETYLAFDTEREDTDAQHDAGANTKLTCKVAGLYLVRAAISWEASATSYRSVLIRKNGVTMIGSQKVNAGATGVDQSISLTVRMAVNDYVECGAKQESGGNLNAGSFSDFSPKFSMARIGS